LLVPVTIALVVTQEMCARMDPVTGKGLASLIRENFSLKVTALVVLMFVICDLGNTASEFAEVASVSSIFAPYTRFIGPGMLKVIMVVAAAVFVFATLTRRTPQE